MFPFFQGEYTGWKESVRHNLSQCDAFKQVLRDPNRPQSKGNFWTVDIDKIPAEQFRRQNTKVSRAVPPGFGYALDLRDIFDITTGRIKIAPVSQNLHPLLRPLNECKPSLGGMAGRFGQSPFGLNPMLAAAGLAQVQAQNLAAAQSNNPFLNQNIQALALAQAQQAQQAQQQQILLAQQQAQQQQMILNAAAAASGGSKQILEAQMQMQMQQRQ